IWDAIDEMRVAYNEELNTIRPMDLPSASGYDEFLAALDGIKNQTIKSGETITLPIYTYNFRSDNDPGVRPGANPEIYSHANVINTFSIFFDVYDSNTGQELTSEETMTGESFCFGECPQMQNGCWPTDGVISTTPYFKSNNSNITT